MWQRSWAWGAGGKSSLSGGQRKRTEGKDTKQVKTLSLQEAYCSNCAWQGEKIEKKTNIPRWNSGDTNEDINKGVKRFCCDKSRHLWKSLNLGSRVTVIRHFWPLFAAPDSSSLRLKIDGVGAENLLLRLFICKRQTLQPILRILRTGDAWKRIKC